MRVNSPSFPRRRESREKQSTQLNPPLPRRERTRACPGLEPGVRVNSPSFPRTPTSFQRRREPRTRGQMGAAHRRPSAKIRVIRGPDNPPTTPLATRKGRHVGAVREPPLILPTHPSFPRGLPRTPIHRREPRTRGQKGAGHHSPSAKICVIRGSDDKSLDSASHLYYHQKCTHTWSQIDGSGQLSSRDLTRGTRTNTLTAIRNMNKVTESIGDRVGGYNFLPALFTFGSRRKQCPLHLVNSKSSFLGCAGSEGYSKDWSPSSMRAPQHKPNDSTRISTGQSSFRGRVRCQSLFIAGERRRCEPGSNSVIVTNTLTSVEGHVLRLGGVLRTRKIFVGCPAIRPIWDQSPGRTASRFETVGNRLYPLHDQDCLRRFTAEAQIQDRSRSKTGPNTAPAFSRVKCPFREAKGAQATDTSVATAGDAPRTPPSFPQGPSFPRRREPRVNKAHRPTPGIPCEVAALPRVPFALRKGGEREVTYAHD